MKSQAFRALFVTCRYKLSNQIFFTNKVPIPGASIRTFPSLKMASISTIFWKVVLHLIFTVPVFESLPIISTTWYEVSSSMVSFAILESCFDVGFAIDMSEVFRKETGHRPPYRKAWHITFICLPISRICMLCFKNMVDRTKLKKIVTVLKVWRNNLQIIQRPESLKVSLVHSKL